MLRRTIIIIIGCLANRIPTELLIVLVDLRGGHVSLHGVDGRFDGSGGILLDGLLLDGSGAHIIIIILIIVLSEDIILKGSTEDG